jgi:uncharacterized membrane protein
MKRILSNILFCFALALPAAADDFDFVSFDFPTCTDMFMSGLNNRAQVVGPCFDGTGVHGFKLNLDGGAWMKFDVPGSSETFATAINDRGVIVGRWKDQTGIYHPYLRDTNGQLTSFQPTAPCVPSTLEPPTVAHGINDKDEIVGRCWDANGNEHGFLRRLDGTFTILDFPNSTTSDAWTISDSGVIVGDYSDSAFNVHGFILNSDGFKTIDFPGAPDSALRDINERGDVTGIYADFDFRLHSFLFKNGIFTSIDFPGAADTGQVDIDNRGFMAGDYDDASGINHGFVALDRNRHKFDETH